MKRLMSSLATCVVGAMLAVPISASAYFTHDEGGFRWRYSVYSDDGTLEAHIDGVHQIDESGNWKEWDATSLTVPATLPATWTNEYARLEKVYDDAGKFLSNRYVTVIGPEVKSVAATVTSVSAGQWSNYKLTSVTIPEAVETVYGFSDCTNLATVTMGAETTFAIGSFDGTPWLKAQGEFVIRDGTLIAYQGTATEVTVPDGVREIGGGAFASWYNEDMTNLTRVTLPTSLKYIGDCAFAECENLATITIPASVKTIGEEAFYYCTALTAIDIPASVRTIDSYAFEDCKKLATVTGCAGVKQFGAYTFYNTAFWNNVQDGIVQLGTTVLGYNGTLPATLTIPEGVTKIAPSAFAYNGEVKTLTLPSSLEEIGSGAFRYSNVKAVNGGDNVTTVPAYTFSGTPYESTCYDDRGDTSKSFELVRLGKVVCGYRGACPATIAISDDVTGIWPELFSAMYDNTTSNITAVTVGSGVKTIGEEAFYGAENLKSATISGPLEEFGWGVFGDCTSLTDATLTGSFLQLEDTFFNCTSLVNVAINMVEPEKDADEEDAWLFVDTYTFSSCDKLASVTVTRPGFQLLGWTTTNDVGEEFDFADEINTFRTYRKYEGYYGSYYNGVTFEANFKRILRDPANDTPFNLSVATTYLGWLTDADGNLVGSVTVKVTKGKKGATTTKATATVTMLGAKKVTLKGTFDANGVGQGALAGLVLTGNGLAGSLTVKGATYTADGARDVSKAAKDPDQAVFKALNKKVWTLVLAPDDEKDVPAFANGFAGLSVSMGMKGKAKLSGTMPDGTKLTISAQTIVGDYNCCIPIIYSKAKSSIGFLVWIDRAGAALDVTAISEWKSKPTGSAAFATELDLVDFAALKAIGESTTFSVEAGDLPASLAGVQTDYLPAAEPVTVAPRKWTLNKAATIKYKKGVFDQTAYDKGVASGKTNKSALKLRYTAKSGLYTGGFSIYTVNNTARGATLKKVTATVNGVVCDGVGYGSATIKKHGTMPVAIGEIDDED